MATGTAQWFTSAFANIVGGETGAEAASLDWITDTVKIALVNAVPNQDTPEFWSDVVATEVVGTNWAAGGQSLASKATIRTDASNRIALDAADVSVATVTVSGVEALVIYKSTGTNSTSNLIGYIDLDATSGSSGGTLNITFDAAGILHSSAA